MTSKSVSIDVDGVTLEGALVLPVHARGLVIFAHGSGCSRFSPRNRFVAKVLEDAGFGTLLLDLLTRDEERVDRVNHELRFDIDFLAERLVGVVDWAAALPEARNLRICLFGASTGAAAALMVAAWRPESVSAVVSRGGRPDLAGAALPHVTAPTLLIVGANDQAVLELNRTAAAALPHARIAIVPGASHLFEEPGTLSAAADLARAWFLRPSSDRHEDEPSLPFANRRQAAALLARRLSSYAGRSDVIVLGLPRGGVPVADTVAKALGAPLDVVVVRKLGAPGQKELALGAIAPGGVRVVNPDVAAYFSRSAVEVAAARVERELVQQERRFRGQRPPLAVLGKVAILVDDGLATGATMRAAIAWARKHGASQVVVAVPVAPPETVGELNLEADVVVCLAMPADFDAVGAWYLDFRPVGDDEVATLLGEEWNSASTQPEIPA